MRRFAILLAAAALFLAGMVSAAYQLAPFRMFRAAKRTLFASPDIPNRDQPYHRQRLSLFEELGTHPTIVVLGDSLVNGGEWGELIPGAVNRGIGSDTTADVASRLGSVLALRPRYVVLMVGINDLNQGAAPAEAARGIEALLARIIGSGAVPISCSVLHVNRDRVLPSNADVAATNALLATWCREHKIAFVDLNATLAPAGYLDPKFSNDGVHLMGAGYSVWAEALRAKIGGF